MTLARATWNALWTVVGVSLLAPCAVGAEDQPDARLKGYRVAPGYKLSLAATEPLVINPVSMTWGPDARLYVIEWKAGRGPNDHIKVLTDKDGDGTFDQANVWMDGFDLPAGLCFWDGWTYITLDHDVVRFHDPDLDGKYDKREVVVSGFGNDDSHHRVSGLVIGPDGWLYMTTGDSDCRAVGSDGSKGTILRSGGVLRCRPDGTKLEVVAFGMRNPFGNVCWDDEFHMFHTDNDNEGSPGFTGCRILHVVDGGDYGWRLREGARCCQPDFERATWNGGRPGRLGWVTETGRGAPAGLCVLNSAAFPPSTRNLLIYPDVFRKLVRAYKLKPRGATFEVDREFELLASDDGLFRPNDAEVGPDGALYILDWRTDSGGAGALSGNGRTGRIYRVTWGGTAEEPGRGTLRQSRLADLLKATDERLITALRSDDYRERTTAGLEFIRRRRDEAPVVMSREEIELRARLSTPLTPFRIPSMTDKYNKYDQLINKFYIDLIKLWEVDPSSFPDYAKIQTLAVAGSVLDDEGYQQRSREFLGGDLLNSRTAEPADPNPVVRRFLYEVMGRFALRNGPYEALTLLSKTEEGYPRVVRAIALALGRLHDFPRVRRGEEVSWKTAWDEYKAVAEGPIPKDPVAKKERGKKNLEAWKTFQARLTTDLIADRLFDMAKEFASADPFLRDGITRGLERLGPAALDALTKALRSEDERMRAAALFTLEGWRGSDGVDAVLAAATNAEDMPQEDRANLFRALRELIANVPPEPIVKWLEKHPKGNAGPRVEAIRVLAAMGVKAHLAAGPALPKLLKDDDAEVRKAAVGLANVARSAEAKAALIDLFQDEKRSNDERERAVVALRGYGDKGLSPLLVDVFHASKDTGLRYELLRTLFETDPPAALKTAREALDEKDEDVRHQAISLLGQRPETALEVANRFNAGKLPKEDLPRVIEAVRNHGTPELQAAMQTLLKDRLLAAPKGAEAERLREFVRRHGNSERGKAIYLDAKKGGCVTCHRLEGDGGTVGPDLTRMWDTLSFDKRVESLLEPSKEIKEGYITYKVATKDGRVLSGLLVADKPDGVTLKDAQGKEVRVPADEIDEKGADPKTSLMPAGVVGHLSFGELADLLSFLGDRRAQESLKKK